MNNSIIEVKNLKTYFPIKKGVFQKIVGFIKAVDDVSFEIKKGESFCIVGESGSGKTTLGRSILNLLPITSGKIFFKNKDFLSMPQNEKKKLRQKIQIVFQDPFSSLNPRKTIGSILIEPLLYHKISKSKKDAFKIAINTLNKCGLNEAIIYKYPHMFSGGQRQRIGIARALILNPEFIVLDEPVSSLDVSVQAQILNLLKKLQNELNLTYLFIAHNLNVVRFFGNKVAVMYLGKIMELGNSNDIFSNPLHPYTKLLLDSIPKLDTKKTKIKNFELEEEIPSITSITTGCKFYSRCKLRRKECAHIEIPLYKISTTHFVRCLLYKKGDKK